MMQQLRQVIYLASQACPVHALAFCLFMLIFLFSGPVYSLNETKSPNSDQHLKKTTLSGNYLVEIHPLLHPVRINRYHHWKLTIQDRQGNPISNARILVSGGMQAHGHGLPAQAKISALPEVGHYLVEGMYFNMDGLWTLAFSISTVDTTDRVIFDFLLDY